SETYEKVAAMIGRRNYATLTFVPAVRDLGHVASSVESPPGVVGAGAPGKSSLAQFDVSVKKHRFETYYELLREWNDKYDQLLTSVDYDLDRPVLLQAGGTSEGIQLSS